MRALLAGVLIVGAAAACAPQAPNLRVDLTDTAIAVDPATVAAGHAVLAIHNGGTGIHELEIIRSDGSPDGLPYDAALHQVKERGKVAERENIAVGATKRLAADLEPGRYVLICNLPGHYDAGMRVALEVR